MLKTQTLFSQTLVSAHFVDICALDESQNAMCKEPA